MSAQHAIHQTHGAVDSRLLVIVSHNFVNIAHMILVVVGEYDPLYRIAPDAIATQFIEHILWVYASIDEHATLRGTDVGTIAATAASETDECQP